VGFRHKDVSLTAKRCLDSPAAGCRPTNVCQQPRGGEAPGRVGLTPFPPPLRRPSLPSPAGRESATSPLPRGDPPPSPPSGPRSGGNRQERGGEAGSPGGSPPPPEDAPAGSPLPSFARVRSKGGGALLREPEPSPFRRSERGSSRGRKREGGHTREEEGESPGPGTIAPPPPRPGRRGGWSVRSPSGRRPGPGRIAPRRGGEGEGD